MADSKAPIVGVIMGSKSDWEYMSAAAEVMAELKVSHEVRIMSAHRTPDIVLEYAANAAGRGLRAIIAGAGGAAHLAGVVASKTIIPVIGVPMPTTPLNGIDSLLSIVQMPKGVPVATMAIGKAGAANAGLLAAQIIALGDAKLGERLVKWRAARAQELLQQKIPVIRAATFPLSAKITVVAKTNPKRPKSAAYQLFEAYKNAGTVAAYIQGVSKLAVRQKAARTALAWDVKHGFITIA